MHHTERNVTTMSDKELLALLVGVNADSFHMESISDVLEAPMTLYGIGEKKALKVEAIGELVRRISSMQARKVETIHGPEDVAHVLMPRVKHEQKEHFMLMCLNTKNHVIAVSDISIGSISASIVHPREVFKEALARSAAAIIIAHNHPSGDPSPSREDINVTQRLAKAGKVMDIPLLDHIVLGDNRFVSLKEKGVMSSMSLS